MEREVNKRIEKYEENVSQAAYARGEFTKRTGLASIAPTGALPPSWLLPQFDPFRVKEQLDVIAFTIERKLADGSYNPRPMLEHVIQKAKGGTRTVCQLTIPDAAASYWLHKRLMRRYERWFSASAFAFRSDRGHVDAIHFLQQEVARHDELWAVEVDFADFFDSIDHDHLMHFLRDELHLKASELELVRKFITCPRARSVADYANGKNYVPTQGIPQGTSISLFLANVAVLELDRRLARHCLRFSRFADDVAGLCATEAEARRSLNIIEKYGQVAGTSIKEGSPGVRRLVRERVGEEDVITSFDYVGARIEHGGVGIAAGSLQKIKKRIGERLHQHLLLYPRRNQFDRRRVVGFDQDLYDAIRGVRRLIYGAGLTEVDVRGSQRKAPSRPLWHLGIVEGSGVADLRELDGWLVSAVRRIHAERCRVLETMGIHMAPVREAALLDGSWAPPAIRANSRLPSFVLARAYLQRWRFQVQGGPDY